jgi:dienelactone hydrolase
MASAAAGPAARIGLITAVVGSTAAVGAAPAVTPKFAVGTVTDTFVDPHRTTPAWDGSPQLPTRTLVTTILYPATGPTGGPSETGDLAAKSAGPFPLIVFAHGLGGTPQDYINLLTAWASQGFVVAAPLFPLSNANVAGGADAGDVVNQPEDMSYVIDAVLDDSLLPSGILSGLVDPKEIGAAGHSNGAVTTLGLVANTCCFDSRVKAAVVMAGTTEGFPPGHYDFSQSPPLLLVHGTSDQLIPYRSAPLIYNEAQGPKGFLTLEGGSHDAAGGQDPRSAQSRGPLSTVHGWAQFDHQDRSESDVRLSWSDHCGSACSGGPPAGFRITGPQPHQRRGSYRRVERLYSRQSHQHS